MVRCIALKTALGNVFTLSGVVMDYDKFYSTKISALREEGRYRVFADLVRRRGEFPLATYHHDGLRDAVVAETRHRTVPAVFDLRGDEPVFVGGSDHLLEYL